MMQQMTEAMAEVVDCVADLSEVMKKDTQTRRTNRVWMGVVAGLVGALIILQFVNLLESSKARDRLFDCTVPGGECHQEGQENQGRAVQAIVCTSAQDTRDVVASIGTGLGTNLAIPPLPEGCEAVQG